MKWVNGRGDSVLSRQSTLSLDSTHEVESENVRTNIWIQCSFWKALENIYKHKLALTSLEKQKVTPAPNQPNKLQSLQPVLKLEWPAGVQPEQGLVLAEDNWGRLVGPEEGGGGITQEELQLRQEGAEGAEEGK